MQARQARTTTHATTSRTDPTVVREAWTVPSTASRGRTCEDYINTDTLATSVFFFFFSSRRRHTRFDCDWSSDVCSSDLSTTPLKLCSFPIGSVKGTTARLKTLCALSSAIPMSECSLSSFVTTIMRGSRSEEHTSELQSQSNLVCRLLLARKTLTLTRYG